VQKGQKKWTQEVMGKKQRAKPGGDYLNQNFSVSRGGTSREMPRGSKNRQTGSRNCREVLNPKRPLIEDVKKFLKNSIRETRKKGRPKEGGHTLQSSQRNWVYSCDGGVDNYKQQFNHKSRRFEKEMGLSDSPTLRTLFATENPEKGGKKLKEKTIQGKRTLKGPRGE